MWKVRLLDENLLLAFTNIRLISRIRRALDTSTCKLLVNALVLSHIDYCGSLLYNINSGLLSKLQRIIHASMRLVEQLGRSDHLSHHLKRHGWLSAEARIKKRLLLLIFKVVKGMAPPYLSALIKQPYSAIGDRVLRSQTRGLLAARACRSKLGGRMFSQSSQQLWNELPSLVRDSSGGNATQLIINEKRSFYNSDNITLKCKSAKHQL
jgi:hypothetical protein